MPMMLPMSLYPSRSGMRKGFFSSRSGSLRPSSTSQNVGPLYLAAAAWLRVPGSKDGRGGVAKVAICYLEELWQSSRPFLLECSHHIPMSLLLGTT